MKVYQILIPAVLCLLAVLLARTEASDDELRRLNNRLFEISKELEARLKSKQMTEPDFYMDDDDKRGMERTSRWNPLRGHSGIPFGKRADVLERAQSDRSKKTRSRTSLYGHSALGYGKRAEYTQDLFEAAINDIPSKKGGIRGFTGNTGILLGKRDADQIMEE